MALSEMNAVKETGMSLEKAVGIKRVFLVGTMIPISKKGMPLYRSVLCKARH